MGSVINRIMLLNNLWHRGQFWRFRCGDCAGFIETTGEPIAAIGGYLSKKYHVWLPLCNPCLRARLDTIPADHCTTEIVVIGFTTGQPVVEANILEKIP